MVRRTVSESARHHAAQRRHNNDPRVQRQRAIRYFRRLAENGPHAIRPDEGRFREFLVSHLPTRSEPYHKC